MKPAYYIDKKFNRNDNLAENIVVAKVHLQNNYKLQTDHMNFHSHVTKYWPINIKLPCNGNSSLNSGIIHENKKQKPVLQ